MNPKSYIHEIDLALGRAWNEDRKNEDFTSEEVAVAAVLTRLDVGLTASLAGYNAKMLYSIKNAVWSLVGIVIIHIVLQNI
jgi:hypothetical protein